MSKEKQIQGDRCFTWSHCWEVNFTKTIANKAAKENNKGKVDFTNIRSIKVEKFGILIMIMIVNDDANYIVTIEVTRDDDIVSFMYFCIIAM